MQRIVILKNKNNAAKTAKQVLIATKWILENVGWCQKRYFSDHNDNDITYHDVVNRKIVPAKCCLTAAIDLVDASQYLKSKVHDLIFMKTADSAISFNDYHSFKQVIEMLDAIINGNTL